MEQEFEEAYPTFLNEQIRNASGRRFEMLQKDLTGEIKLLKEVIWPVFKTFEGFTLEYEMKSISGVHIFADVFYHPLRIIFESDGFVAHAEKITRERFSFERGRMRTFAMYGYKYVPFSWDELDKRPEDCRRTVYALLGKYTGSDDRALKELTVFEREVIRYALRLHRPFQIADVCYCLQVGKDTARKVLKSLHEKGLIRSGGLGTEKIRNYVLSERAQDYLL